MTEELESMRRPLLVAPEEVDSLIADGFQVFCYIDLAAPKKNEKKKARNRRRVTAPNTKIAINMKGKLPGYGRFREQWPSIRRDLFNNDPTEEATYGELLEAVKAHGLAVSAAAHALHVYRVVEVVG